MTAVSYQFPSCHADFLLPYSRVGTHSSGLALPVLSRSNPSHLNRTAFDVESFRKTYVFLAYVY